MIAKTTFINVAYYNTLHFNNNRLSVHWGGLKHNREEGEDEAAEFHLDALSSVGVLLCDELFEG